jgi:hypothetical protein
MMSQRLREKGAAGSGFIGHVDELRGTRGGWAATGEIRLTLYHEDEAVKASENLTAEQHDCAARSS